MSDYIQASLSLKALESTFLRIPLADPANIDAVVYFNPATFWVVLMSEKTSEDGRKTLLGEIYWSDYESTFIYKLYGKLNSEEESQVVSALKSSYEYLRKCFRILRVEAYEALQQDVLGEKLQSIDALEIRDD